MKEMKPLRVAALVDLPRSRISGGHIKGWENLVRAAAVSDLPLDLTLFTSGEDLLEEMGPNARIRQVPAVFSTQKLKFLPYVPDNTDLGSFHKNLAAELADMDVIHTTDGYFCFAKTAERLARKHKIGLTTSFHTDTPSYARVFTKYTIENIFGEGRISHFLCDTLHLPERQERSKIRRMKRHLRRCQAAFYTRDADRDLAADVIGPDKVHVMRLGVDRSVVGPHRADRRGVETDYHIPPERIIFLFVGRLDVGKNIYTLIEAMENLIADGLPVHLITAGLGPAADDLKARLGDRVTVAGFVDPDELARLYASVDGLALTSEVEIRSMAAVEAMTSGLPILVSEKSGIARLFDNSPAMVVVPSGAEAWTQAMQDLAGSVNQRTHMRKVALSYAESYIASWGDVLAHDLMPIWQEAAANARRSKNPVP